MGVLPLQFPAGASRESLGLTGEEVYSITGLAGADPAAPLPSEVTVRAERDGQNTEFVATVRIDTPAEAAYYRHGGHPAIRPAATARKHRLRAPAPTEGGWLARRRVGERGPTSMQHCSKYGGLADVNGLARGKQCQCPRAC